MIYVLFMLKNKYVIELYNIKERDVITSRSFICACNYDTISDYVAAAVDHLDPEIFTSRCLVLGPSNSQK